MCVYLDDELILHSIAFVCFLYVHFLFVCLQNFKGKVFHFFCFLIFFFDDVIGIFLFSMFSFQ